MDNRAKLIEQLARHRQLHNHVDLKVESRDMDDHTLTLLCENIEDKEFYIHYFVIQSKEHLEKFKSDEFYTIEELYAITAARCLDNLIKWKCLFTGKHTKMDLLERAICNRDRDDIKPFLNQCLSVHKILVKRFHDNFHKYPMHDEMSYILALYRLSERHNFVLEMTRILMYLRSDTDYKLVHTAIQDLLNRPMEEDHIFGIEDYIKESEQALIRDDLDMTIWGHYLELSAFYQDDMKLINIEGVPATLLKYE